MSLSVEGSLRYFSVYRFRFWQIRKPFWKTKIGYSAGKENLLISINKSRSRVWNGDATEWSIVTGIVMFNGYVPVSIYRLLTHTELGYISLTSCWMTISETYGATQVQIAIENVRSPSLCLLARPPRFFLILWKYSYSLNFSLATPI